MKYSEYPSYKDSGDEWLGKIPDGWNVVKFGFTNKSATLGGNYLAGEAQEGISVIKMGNIGRGVINLSKTERLQAEEPFDKTHLLSNGDFLFNTRNSLDLVGKVSIWNGELKESIYNSNILKIVFEDKFVENSYYMSYLFNSSLGLSLLRLIAKGTTNVAAIYYKELSSLKLSLPPLQEQKAIANYLDKATAKIDALIAKQTRLIELLKEKRQAVISTAVTRGLDSTVAMKDSGVEWLGEIPEHWDASPLKYLTRQIIDGAHFTPTYVDKGIPFLRVTDLHNKKIDLDKVKFIPLDEHKELIRRCKPEKGDLLLSKNGTIGLTKIIDWDWEFSVFVSLCLIKFKHNKMLAKYFLFIFQSNAIEEQLFHSSQKTSVTNLHLDKINELYFSLPSLKEQQQIVDHLNDKTSKIDKLIIKSTKAIDLLKEKRTALISSAVTGKIDVRSYND